MGVPAASLPLLCRAACFPPRAPVPHEPAAMPPARFPGCQPAPAAALRQRK